MKKRILIVMSTALLVGKAIIAQTNLVFNPSFELFDSCSSRPGNIHLVKGWTSANSCTPDYFNPCNTGDVGTPSNSQGYQVAQNGSSYIGIETQPYSDIREAIQGTLNAPLQMGKYYRFDMYISIGDNAGCYVNEIGVYFDDDPTNASNFNCDNLLLAYQLKLDVSEIRETQQWHKITGTYLATGGEKYFIISFFDPSLTLVHFGNSDYGQDVAYYYLDNFSLMESQQPTYKIPSAFSPNGDGINDIFIIQNLSTYPNNSLTIIDRNGVPVYEAKPYNNDWNGMPNMEAFEGKEKVPHGTYFYIFKSSPNAATVQGSLEIR